MSYLCTLYGLGLSVSHPIAGLQGLAAPSAIDVTVSLGALPEEVLHLDDTDVEPYYVAPYRDEQGRPTHRIARLLGGRFFKLDYVDGTTFVIDARATAVWAVWPQPYTVEDTAAYLLGPVMGFVLRLRGVTCLHASAVAVDGKAVVLVGESGAGKSTTAAAFAQRGYPVMSDDVVPVTDDAGLLRVHPAYPRLRLWPVSVAALFGSPDALPLITPNWGKRFLDLRGPTYLFQAQPLPLGAIYFMGDRQAQAQVGDSPSRQALMRLVANTYASRLLTPDLRAGEFDMLAKVAAQVPTRSITAADDLGQVGQLCQAILHDLARLPPPTWVDPRS